jgi:hypothetical protein
MTSNINSSELFSCLMFEYDCFLRCEIRTLSQEFIDGILGNNGKVSRCSVDTKRQERERFEKVLAGCRSKIDADSKGLVRKFDAKKKQLLRVIASKEVAESEKKLNELRTANVRSVITRFGFSGVTVLIRNANDILQVQLNDDLLELELQQMEQDEQIISAFEQSYNQLVAAFIDTVQSDFCAKLRDIENEFFDKALQVIITSP